MVRSVGTSLKMNASRGVPFIVATEGIIDEAWCRKVKRAMMAAAFAQFLREYANDRGGVKPSRAKRHAMADFLEKAAAYTEIGERCPGVAATLNVAEAAEAVAAASPRGSAEEAHFKGLSTTCVIEARILVKELGDALQAAIKMPLPKGMPHEMAAAAFYARQRHFHAWGMGHLPSGADEELRQRFSEALSQMLSAAAKGPVVAYGSLHCEDMEAFILEHLDDEDEREDARAMISDLDACFEKAVRNEIPKFCTLDSGCCRPTERGSSIMTHVEWIRRIRGGMLILEQYFDKRNQHRFFSKDARYHMETALPHPCTKRHFDERIGDVVAAEIRRFDERMLLLSRLTNKHRYVTPEQVAAAVGLCRRQMAETGVHMTACHQATLSGMLYAMEPADVDVVASFCAAEFTGCL